MAGSGELSQAPGLVDYARLFEPPHATPAEHLGRDVFIALMWALSYPGQAYELPPAVLGQAMDDPTLAACIAVGQVLLDLETSYFTTDPRLTQRFAPTGARALPAAAAAYHFYPAPVAGDPAAEGVLRDNIAAARVGDFLYPDHSATLVMACTLDRGTSLRLQGPGIDSAVELRIGGLPSGFWRLRSEAIRYPLGWDVFFLDGGRVVGLPRTTVVEVMGPEE